MPSKELIEKVAQAIDRAEDACFERDPTALHKARAQAAISTILAALQEPNAAMMFAGSNQLDDDGDYDAEHVWQSMLAASALGEQSE